MCHSAKNGWFNMAMEMADPNCFGASISWAPFLIWMAGESCGASNVKQRLPIALARFNETFRFFGFFFIPFLIPCLIMFMSSVTVTSRHFFTKRHYCIALRLTDLRDCPPLLSLKWRCADEPQQQQQQHQQMNVPIWFFQGIGFILFGWCPKTTF